MYLPDPRKVSHVYSGDRALDKTSPTFDAAWKKFLGTGDISVLPLLPGQQPVVWQLSSVMRRHKLQMSHGLSTFEMSDLMVRDGLVGVTGLKDAAGRIVELEMINDGFGGRQLSPDAMEKIHRLGIGFINEIGARILEITEPGPTSGQA